MLHKAKLPGIPGIEDFQGHSFHTSRWDYKYTGGGPEEPMDKLHDKVVAIIGTGATAVQAVPKLAEAAKQLLVFQRTPSSMSPRNQRDTDPEWFAEMSSKPGWHEERMENFIGTTTGGNSPATFYTRRLGFDPIGVDGVSLSDAWAKGAWILHGVFAHGFPNLCMNSHIQGGQHINIAYASTKAAEHTAWVIKRALDRRVIVEPELDAEEDWFQTVMGTVGAYGAYFAACTPGYLNNEFEMPGERDSRSACYTHRAVDFKNILAAWRNEGSMTGLKRTPIHG